MVNGSISASIFLCPIGAITAVGGGIRHALWLDYLAAALDRPLTIRSGGEAGAALGAVRTSPTCIYSSNDRFGSFPTDCLIALGLPRKSIVKIEAHRMNDTQFSDFSGPVDRDWQDRLATLAVFFANGLGFGAWAASIPALKARLLLSDGQLSIALLSFACGAFISMPLAGWLGTRIRTGHTTIAASFAFAIALVMPAFTLMLPILCGATAAAGACTGAADVLMNSHAGSIERRWRAPIMSSFHAAFSVGGMAGALLGVGLASRGVLAELGTAATICAILVLAAAFLMRPGDVAPTGKNLAVADRPLLALGLIAMLTLLIEGAVADWSGVLLLQGGANIRSTSFGFAAFSCFMAGGRLLGDWLVGRLGAATIVRFGGALAAAGLVLVAFLPTPLAGAAGFGMVGVGLSNVVPTVFSATGRMGAYAASAVVTAGYAGLLLGPVAIGSVATVSNLSWGMVALAIAAVAVSVLAANSSAFAPPRLRT